MIVWDRTGSNGHIPTAILQRNISGLHTGCSIRLQTVSYCFLQLILYVMNQYLKFPREICPLILGENPINVQEHPYDSFPPFL